MIAVVTGGSRGLGRAICVELGRRGYRVGVGYRAQEDEARTTLAAVGDGFLVRLDVADADATSDALARVVKEEGGVDLLVNDAAIVDDALFAISAADEWRRVVEVDLVGTANACRAVARHMMARRRGAIVNVSSVAGLRATSGQSAYAAAKAGVIALTRSLAQELAPHGVRVNAVVPGLLDTGSGARLGGRERAAKLARIPLGRAGTAEEVAKVVAFLASDDASYIVGAALVVDGGITL